MWTIKTFATIDDYKAWVLAHEAEYEIEELFVNNAYGLRYRKLRTI